MNKAFLQLLVLVAVFLALWFGFSRIDFVKKFRLDELGSKTEKKIGDAIMKSITTANREVEGDSVQEVLDDIKTRMLQGNPDIPSNIQLHLVVSKEVNAFALPGNHIVIYTGLIKCCDSAEELAGVLSHEMAHITLNHVMKRLAGEIGLAVLASATTGNSQVIHQVIKTLSSTAFERKQESEADAEGVKYLVRAHISPYAFAGIMSKLADLHKNESDMLEWISSHPDSKKRAATIQQLADAAHGPYTEVIDHDEWELLQNAAGK